MAGNHYAKNWQEEAREILEDTMKKYWQARPAAQNLATQSTPNTAQADETSILSDFDHHRLTLLASRADNEGWQTELRRYLKDVPSDVMKDTDIVEWWQNNGSSYPTLCHIAIDYLACQASSVPCERLFSSGGEVAMKWHAQLGAGRFEELQVLKFAWRNNIGNLTAWNSV